MTSLTAFLLRGGWVAIALATALPSFAQNPAFSNIYNVGNGLYDPTCDWADFNNDGYMDLLVVGNNNIDGGPDEMHTGRILLYQNSNGNTFIEKFDQLVSGISSIGDASAAWGDYNRDGYMDFAVTGVINNSCVVSIYRNNGPGQNWRFTKDCTMPGVHHGCLSWSDFNNDGLPDLFLAGKNQSGSPCSYLYSNTGPENQWAFNPVSSSITGLYNSSSDWADYNHDGWDDLLLSGMSSSNYPKGVTLVYTNLKNGHFGSLGFSCNPDGNGNTGYYGNAEWGDYDNDGYVDILSVSSEKGSSWVYKNVNGGSFAPQNHNGLGAMTGGRAHWGDYNNDNKLDVSMVGLTPSHNGSGEMLGCVYVNGGNGTFTQLSNSGLDFFAYSNSSWADFDNDGDLDLFEAGLQRNQSASLAFYRNNLSYVAYAPAQDLKAPTGLRHSVINDGVLFSWELGDSIANTYNVYLSTDPNKCTQFSPASNISNGWRKLVRPGNAGHTGNLLVEHLTPGTYYWSVQAVNTAWQGSPFAPQGAFTVPGSETVAQIQVTGDGGSLCDGQSVTLKALSYPRGSSWQWYKDGVLLVGTNTQTIQASSAGSYTVTVSGYDEHNRYFTVSSPAVSVRTLAAPGPPTAIPGVSVCENHSATLTAVPGANATTCQWYDGDGYIAQGNSITRTPIMTTTYQCYSYDISTGCMSTTYAPSTITVNPLPPAPGVMQTGTCIGSPATLTVSSRVGLSCYWYNSYLSTATPLFVGNTFVTPPLQSTSTTYYAEFVDDNTLCKSSRAGVTINATEQPDAPYAQDGFRCGNGPVTLRATPGHGGNTCMWYKQAEGGQPFFTGTTYTTVPLTHDTLYYVSSSSGTCESATRSVVHAELNPVFTKPYGQSQFGYVTHSQPSVTVNLFARPGTRGNTCRWYSDSLKHGLLATTTNYTTPAIDRTQTYYVTSYDEATGCEGTAYAVIQAVILTAPTRQLNPDQVYPVASVPGNQSSNGVNLCTGDVMQTFELGSIQSGQVAYQLKAMYNSRSMALTPWNTTNAMGGLGWKLLDYPKMVYDDVKKRYFYLDGIAVYPLDTVAQVGNNLQLRASGDSWLKQFTLDVSSLDVSQRKWTMTDEGGVQFSFSNNAQPPVGGDKTISIWHLSKICDTQHRDSLMFHYANGGLLTLITASDGGLLEVNLAQGTNRIGNVKYYTSSGNDQLPSNSGNVLLSETKLTYGQLLPSDRWTTVLTRITNYYNAALSVGNSVQMMALDSGLVFSYQSTSPAGALSSIQYPEGGVVKYNYGRRDYREQGYFPVLQSTTYPGTYAAGHRSAKDSLPVSYDYIKAGIVPPYSLYNKVRVLPGQSRQSIYDNAGITQGSEEYYFFNGMPSDSLLHLPDAYAEPYMTDSLLEVWFTGFEAGTNRSTWLNLHGGDCKASIQYNKDLNDIAYAGSAALLMEACEHNGDKSYIETHSLAVPRGTKRLKVAFRYSNSELPKLKYKVSVQWNGGSKDSTVTIKDNSPTLTEYKLFFMELPLPSNAGNITVKVSVIDAGTNQYHNSFNIDNFRIVCVGNAHAPNGATFRDDPSDPILNGKLYCSRGLKANFNELHYQETCFYPASLPSGSKVALPRTMLTVKNSSALNYTVLRYNSLGLPLAAVTTTELRDSLDRPFVQLYMRKFNYGSEFYPQLGAGKYYMPTVPILQQNLTKQLGQGDWQVISAMFTEWKEFSSNPAKPVFEPWRTYNLVAPVGLTGMDSVVNALKANPSWTPPSYRWAKLSEVLQRNDKGLPTWEVNELGIPSFVQYSTESFREALAQVNMRIAPMPVAVFNNATPNSAFFLGGEEYEKPAGRVEDTPVEANPFSGEKSYQNTLTLGFKFINSQPAGQKYVCGFWAMAQTNSILVSVGGQSMPRYSNTLTIPDSLHGKWAYYETVFPVNVSSDSLTITLRVGSQSPITYFDDIRFCPATATFSASVYDILDQSLVCAHGNNGDYQRVLYGHAGNASGAVKNGETPIGVNAKYYSRDNAAGTDRYLPNKPNCDIALTAKGKGVYYGMYDKAQTDQWTLTNATKSNGGLFFNSNASATLKTAYLPSDFNDLAISFTFSPDCVGSSDKDFSLSIGRYQLKFVINASSEMNIKFIDPNGTYLLSKTIHLPSKPTSYYPIDVALLFQNNHALLWVNGASYTMSWNATNGRGISFSSTNNTSVYVTNLQIISDPLLNLSYSDGLGNVIQQHSLTKQGTIVAQQLYDRMLRPSVTTKPVLLENLYLADYDTLFVSAFDWTSGLMSGEVDQANEYCDVDGHDLGYFYSRVDFEAAPASLPAYQFNPGKDFALRSSSNLEKARHWVHDLPDEIVPDIIDAVSDAFYAFDIINMILVPEDAPLIIVMNAAGMLVSKVVGTVEDYVASKVGGDAPELPITKYFYEQRSLLKEIRLPNANSHKDPQRTQTIKFLYDFNGNTSKLTTPESGATTAVYDIHGRLRFSQDALLASQGKIEYLKYDALGRLVEEGSFTSVWSYSALQAKSGDNSYPTSAQHPVVSHKYLYDGAGGALEGSAMYRGRLSAEMAFDNGAPSFREDYTYNPEGLVLSCAQSIVYQDIPKDTFYLSYAYDNLGNLIHVNYPPVNGRPFAVRYTYNKMNLMDTIFTSLDGKLATYDWNPDGSLKKKRLNNSEQHSTTFPVIFSYNAPAWLTNIFAGDSVSHKPRFFNHNLNYNFLDSWWDKLGGEKYYNGNVAGSTYTPGSGTGLESQQEGYKYNEYGALESYYSNHENEGVGNWNTSQPYLYQYDLNGNVTGRSLEAADRNLPNTLDSRKYSYQYDKVHNRLDRMTVAESVTLMSTGIIHPGYNGNYLYYRYDTTFLAYDAGGNVNEIRYNQHKPVSVQNEKGDWLFRATRRFVFNHDGLLDSASLTTADQSINTCRFRYNNAGTRIVKDTRTTMRGAGNSTLSRHSRKTYIRGGGGDAIGELTRTLSGGLDTTRYYIMGPAGDIEAMYQYAGGGWGSWFILKDYMGSSVQMVNRLNNSLSAAWDYDDYGNLVPSVSKNPHLFSYLYTGQEYDAELGAYNYKARIYEPSLRMFLSPDPAMDNPALPYAYVENDPVNHVDPTGMVPTGQLAENILRRFKFLKEIENGSPRAMEVGDIANAAHTSTSTSMLAPTRLQKLRAMITRSEPEGTIVTRTVRDDCQYCCFVSEMNVDLNPRLLKAYLQYRGFQGFKLLMGNGDADVLRELGIIYNRFVNIHPIYDLVLSNFEGDLKGAKQYMKRRPSGTRFTVSATIEYPNATGGSSHVFKAETFRHLNGKNYIIFRDFQHGGEPTLIPLWSDRGYRYSDFEVYEHENAFIPQW